MGEIGANVQTNRARHGKGLHIEQLSKRMRKAECPQGFRFNLAGIARQVLDALFGVLVHRRRGRCPFPSALSCSSMFDLRLPVNGS